MIRGQPYSPVVINTIPEQEYKIIKFLKQGCQKQNLTINKEEGKKEECNLFQNLVEYIQGCSVSVIPVNQK